MRAVSPPWPVLDARRTEVVAEDGVRLSARVAGPDDAAATVVLAHGYCLSQDLWDRQVAALTAARPDLRVVTYDQRGHGRSGRTSPERATLAQLGRDLRAVLDALAPEGPVVLAGHSMGGMTVMAFAEQYPELVGPRVVGAALVATSAGELASSTWGFPEAVARRVRTALPAANEHARRREDRGLRPLSQAFMAPVLLGRGRSKDDVRRTLAVLRSCSAHTRADFHATFLEHDRVAALAALSGVPVLVLCGDRDRICPLAHSEAIARALPHARFVVYPGSGHMVQLERADDVSRRLVELVASALRPAGQRVG